MSLKKHIKQIRGILQNLYDFAHSFNSRIFLRYTLWKNGRYRESFRFHLVYLGFMKEKSQLPGLLQQEKQALETQILLIYHQYLTAPDETKKKQYLDEFIE